MKAFYPFRLAATSFTYYDSYAANVELLGPFVDEVELLIFESNPKNKAPSSEEIHRLGQMADTWNITYNVHLPLDS